MIRETFEQAEVVYVAGVDLAHARERMELSHEYVKDNAQDAYDEVGYWENRSSEFEVYEFSTITRIVKVEPPYTKR